MIYVDHPHHFGMRIYGRKVKTCHMYADSKDELISFAVDIGLNPSWLHLSRRGVPHFDITENKRNYALGKGAIEFPSHKDQLKFLKKYRG